MINNERQMKFKKYSAKTVTELLLHLAEHEEFSSLEGLKEFGREEVSEIIKEIVNMIQVSSSGDGAFQKTDLSGFELSSKALTLISSLSPREESILFKSFQLMDR